MGKEQAREIFRQQLAALGGNGEAEAEKLKKKNDEIVRLASKFDKETEKSLIEAEERFLKETEPVASVAGILEEACKTIEKRERKEPGSIKQSKIFRVDILGDHGTDSYPEYYNQVDFVKAVEDGKSIDSSISGVILAYTGNTEASSNCVHLWVKMEKDEKSLIFPRIAWYIGEKNGVVEIGNLDVTPFATLVAEKVANRDFYKKVEYPGWGDWSLN